jgi:heme exporter protein C
VAPPDYQQGESVRIMYVHVPAAWMALFVYTNIAIASAVALIWCHPLADLAAKASAPLGAGFTFLALATGSLWGKPMWGTWWVWDARLTSVLVLFFLYLGHMALMTAFEDPARGRKAAAVLALVGFVNVPIIKFSVDWWNTLHQPASVLRADGPTIHPDMLWPLLAMAVGFQFYYVSLLLVRIKSELIEARLRALGRAAMASSVAPAPAAQSGG